MLLFLPERECTDGLTPFARLSESGLTFYWVISVTLSESSS